MRCRELKNKKEIKPCIKLRKMILCGNAVDVFPSNVVKMPFKQHDGLDEKIEVDFLAFAFGMCAFFVVHEMPFSCSNFFFIPRLV